MFNNIFITIVGLLVAAVIVLIVLLNISGKTNDKLEADLTKEINNNKALRLQVMYSEEAKGLTEKFEAIKPLPEIKVKYEEINTSIGKHHIIIK